VYNITTITPFMHGEELKKRDFLINEHSRFETQFRARDFAYITAKPRNFESCQQKGADDEPPGTRRFAYYY